MRCGNCKGSHDTVDAVRECYKGKYKTDDDGPQWPASDKQKDYVIGLQKERMLPEFWTMYNYESLSRMERDDVSGVIVMLKSFAKKAGTDGAPRVPNVPAGRYALHERVSSGLGIGPLQWRFYEVQDGKGRWDGYKFIKRLIGSPGDYQKNPVPASDRDRLFRMIEDNPDKAMTDYGLQSGVCGKCGSPLTDPVSLARGIGPKCLGKLGW